MPRKAVYAWALYDWANSAFTTTVMAGFFPVFYKQYWAGSVDTTTSTFQLGLGNSLSSLIIVILAPFLGAVADFSRRRKQFLAVFAIFGASATALLYSAGQGDWAAALMLYIAATIGFMGANIFYDALLVFVSDNTNRDRVSALGYALGYLGGGLLFAVNVAMTLSPEAFGLANATEAIKISFLTVSVWWLIFSIPLWRYVPEGSGRESLPLRIALRTGWHNLLQTLRRIRRLKPVVLFLLAYWLYIDGVDTIVRMAVDYGLAIGLQHTDLITALLITQFVGFPAALAFGHIGQRWGTRRGIFLGIGVYIAAVIGAAMITTARDFYILAAIIGLVQGGVQSLSRSYYADLIPPQHCAEFFGFYNMMGKTATLLGPLLVGVVAMTTDSHRAGLLAIIVLFLGGAWILTKVEPARPSPETRPD